MPTDEEIQQAIRTILSATDGANAEPIEEPELIRRVLNFANSGRPEGLPGSRTLMQGGQVFTVVTEDTPKQQTQLRRDLAGVAARNISSTRLGQLRLSYGRQVLVPVVGFANGKMRLRYRYLPVEDKPGGSALAGTLTHVLLRIHSDAGLTDDLRQCQLPGCGNFFLMSDQVSDPAAPGRRRYRYCTDEHMKAGQTGGAERTRKWRENVAKKLAATARHK